MQSKCYSRKSPAVAGVFNIIHCFTPAIKHKPMGLTLLFIPTKNGHCPTQPQNSPRFWVPLYKPPYQHPAAD